MSETALEALYRAVRMQLAAETFFAGRVYADVAPPKTARPFCVFSYAAGGERNQLVKPDAEIELTVRCVADTLQDAFAGAGAISNALNDADLSDPKALNGGPSWEILHTRQLGIVHMRELVDGRDVYHEGHRFSFRMEGK